MPQVSLYIDRDLYKEVEARAKEKGQSLSGFVSDVLRENLRDSWPEHFFERYVGALRGRVFGIPEDAPWLPDKGETF